MKTRRNAAKLNGLLRRVDVCGFEKVTDPRHAARVVHPLVGLRELATLALATHARIEALQLGRAHWRCENEATGRPI